MEYGDEEFIAWMADMIGRQESEDAEGKDEKEEEDDN